MQITVEFVLGLLGGILGFLFPIMSTSFPAGGILFGTVGIIGAALVQSKTKIAGILMLISAVGGIGLCRFAYLLPAILLAIAGVMALLKVKSQLEKEEKS